MKKVKVTALGSTYRVGSDKYGPFVATKEQPFLEVPQSLAEGLGLALYELGESDPADSDATEGQELLQANADLKADLDQVTAERDSAQRRIQDFEEIIRTGKQANEDQHDRIVGLTQERDAARAELATAQQDGGNAQAQVATLTAELETAKADAADQYIKSQNDLDGLQKRVAELGGVVLPADAKERLVAVSGIAAALADKAIAALTAPAQAPVER